MALTRSELEACERARESGLRGEGWDGEVLPKEEPGGPRKEAEVARQQAWYEGLLAWQASRANYDLRPDPSMADPRMVARSSKSREKRDG